MFTVQGDLQALESLLTATDGDGIISQAKIPPFDFVFMEFFSLTRSSSESPFIFKQFFDWHRQSFACNELLSFHSFELWPSGKGLQCLLALGSLDLQTKSIWSALKVSPNNTNEWRLDFREFLSKYASFLD